MESLDIISQWLKKQHVLTFCTGQAENLWCANAFYIFDNKTVTFYLLSETTTRHGQLIGQRATTAGTINGQPKSIALIRGVQFQGEITLLSQEQAEGPRAAYCRRFPIAKAHNAPLWAIRLNELKMTDNTLGFGKKIHWLREGAIGR